MHIGFCDSYLRLLALTKGCLIVISCSVSIYSQSSFETEVDSIVYNAIDSLAFPGAQILVMKSGDIVFEKSYGYHTYDQKIKLEPHHLFDLASITKVSTGLPLLMNLVAKGKVDLDDPASKYLSTFKRSNKKKLSTREILAHQAGLQPYIVYYADMKNGEKWGRKTFKEKQKRQFSVAITDSLFMHKGYQKKMARLIKKTILGEKIYRYSGLYFQLLPQLIEKMKGRSFLEVLTSELYEPLEINKGLTYLPKTSHALHEIVPTEIDSNFRMQLVHGTVHDEAAAMWGGVSCNAGLFGNARSLGTLFQVFLDDGLYKGRRFIDSTAIAEFTSCQYCETENRRGLGFDKPQLEYDETLSSVAKDASPESFGHSGFTGTLVWADPKYELVYVFLSNRVYPSRNHRNLYEMNVRPKIHQLVYDYYKDE
jgi:CubicO group peptidase (beta-lactamase class C family)